MEKEWKVLSSEYSIREHWLTVRKDHVLLPSGVEIEDYYILEYPGWVTVIAITDDFRYVVTKQYRHGIRKVCYELSGGAAEFGEDLMQAAKRELKEETGYGGGEWKLFTVSAPNSANMTNMCYTFLATGVQKTSNQDLDRTEDIEVCLLTEKEMINAIDSGSFIQGNMLAAIWRWLFLTASNNGVLFLE